VRCSGAVAPTNEGDALRQSPGGAGRNRQKRLILLN
jgi:hypothetical protein